MTDNPKRPTDNDDGEDNRNEESSGQPDQQSAPVDTYKVGPGHPPKEHQFKKGGRRGNPFGRKPKPLSMEPDLKKALETALGTKVEITRDNKKVLLSKATLGIEQLVNQYAKGDRHARRDLFQYADRLGVDLTGQKKILENALTPDHQAILESYVKRRGAVPAPETPREKAPPELLDDDVTASPDDSTPAEQKPRMGPEPLPPEILALPMGSRARIKAIREFNVAQNKKLIEES